MSVEQAQAFVSPATAPLLTKKMEELLDNNPPPVFNIPEHRLKRARGVGTGKLAENFQAARMEVVLGQMAPSLSLADSGASLSLIDEDLARKAWPDVEVRHHADAKSITGLGGTATTGGYIVADLRIPTCWAGKPLMLVVEHELHLVKGLSCGMLLGQDFLTPHGVCLDLGRAVAIFGEGPVASLYRLSQDKPPPQAMTLMVSADVHLAPGDSAWVRVDPPQPPHDQWKGDLLVEKALWVDDANDSAFLVQSALIRNNFRHVFVTNTGTNDAFVYSNMPITTAVPFTGSSTPAKDVINGVEQDAFFTVTPHWDKRTRPRRETAQEKQSGEQSARTKSSAAAQSCNAETSTSPSSRKTTCEPLDERLGDGDAERVSKPVAGETTKVDGHFHVGLDPVTGLPYQSIVELLREKRQAFSLDGKPGRVRYPGMTIPVDHPEKLTAQPPRRKGPKQRDDENRILDDLIDLGIVEPSSSPMSSPVLLVYQDDKTRFCVDYRALNDVTTSDRYPLPRADDVFEALQGSTIFSALDAVKGYHQLEVAPEDRWKTAFACSRGLFQYTKIPFGLKGAPAHFQRFMDGLIHELRWTCAMVYLDDVVVYTSSLEDHHRALTSLLDSAINVGLKFDPKKCHFALPSLKLLGRIVSADGVSVIPDRVKAIREIEMPRTYAELSSFLGLVGYYRYFIPRYAKLAAPLHALLKGCQHDKQAPGGGKKPLILPDGTRGQPRNLPLPPLTAEHRNCVQGLKDELARVTTLAYPDFTKPFFLYIDACQKQFASAVHQQALIPLKEGSKEEAHFISIDFKVSPTELRDLQRDDPLWSGFIRALEEGEPRHGYELQDGMLVRAGTRQICLPQAAMLRVFEEAHKGHFNWQTTHCLVDHRWWHPRLAERVRSFVAHCPECLRTKLKPRSGEMTIEPPLEFKAFFAISIDIILGLPKSKGFDACLTVLCLATKVTLFAPTKSTATATDVATLLEDLLVRRGFCPKRIISDFDKRFIGDVGRALARKWGATLTPSAPYHQQANPVERYIQIARDSLRRLCLHDGVDKWPDKIPALEALINSRPSNVTKYAPYDLLYIDRSTLWDEPMGHSGVDSLEQKLAFGEARIRQAIEAIGEARRKQKQRYDGRRQALPSLKEGDRVMLRLVDHPLPAARAGSKLEAPLEGPLKVAKIISKHRVRLVIPRDLRIEPEVDVTQLQKVPDDDEWGRPGFIVDDGHQEYFEPLQIVNERLFHGHKQFRVRWANSSRLTWEFEDDLRADGCQDLIDDWEFSTPPPEQAPVPAAPSAGPAATEPAASADNSSAAAPVPTTPPTSEVNIADTSDTPVPLLTPEAEAQRWLETPLHPSAAHALDQPIARPRRILIDGKPFLLIERPIAFSSKSTSAAESKMLGSELETCCLAWAFFKHRHHLEGADLIVVTDHAPLEGILKAKQERVSSETLRLARQRLAPYIHKFKFVYKPGKTHNNVDGLSRVPTSSS